MLLTMMATTGTMWGQTTDDLDFSFSNIGSTGWTNSYAQHVVEFDNATVTFASASKQTGTITNYPVTKGQPVSVVLNESTNNITSVTFTCVQWGTKAQTITLHYSTNGGTSYTSTGITSNNFTISSNNLPEGTNAVKITFSSTSNQVGIGSCSVTFESGGSSSLQDSDLALTDAPIALEFDLYNNSDAQVINYSTSSTGAVTVSESEFIETEVDETNKTITVTPIAVTNTAQTITVSQAADDNYKAGSQTFTVSITDSTPFVGGDVTFVAGTDKGTSTGQNPDQISKSGVTVAGTSAALATSEYRFYSGSTTTISTTSGNITQIIFTGNSTSYPVSRFSVNDNNGEYSVDNNVGTWAGNSTSISFSASGQARASQIVVTVAAQTSDPYITAANVDIDYDATGGNIAFTVNNEVTGGTISAATSDSWITLGSETTSPITFTCSANSETIARTAEVTLTYTYNTNETVTKDVTITQAAAPVVYSTIPALFAAATTTETNVEITFDSWVVSGVSNKNVFVTDNNGNGFVIFDNAGGLGDVYSEGDILTGTAVSCTLKLYNGFAEILNLSSTDLTIADGGTVTVADIEMASLAGVNTGALLHYDNLTCSISNNKYYLSDGTTTIQVYNALFAFDALEDGKSYNITGVYQQYNNTKEILPRSADDIEEVVPTVPTVTVANATVNIEAEGGEGTLTVTYENITEVVADVWFCNAEGTEDATYGWITAEINDQNNVEYLVEPNDGDERTAYFKVWAYDDDMNEVYSNLVTVTQAEYVAPTYAELPFEFNGGRADIENTDGLYQEGLGTDYNSVPKLKFDGTGDWLLLQFNERPGTLTFDIKGNGYSSGSTSTFKVQTSADGMTYTDLVTYTELGDTQNESFDNLDENVRYIKWIYTEKGATSGGNVGLGNIALAEYVAPVASITVTPDLIEAPAIPVAPATVITGSLTVTLSNITITELDQLGVDFCDENGTLLTGANTKPSWFESTFELVGEEYKLNYTIAANTETTERVAYFKVYEVDSEVYSNKVTVTQEAYVAPTATITLEEYAIDAPADGTNGSMTVTLENMTITDVDNQFTIDFFHLDGSDFEPGEEKPDWVTAEFTLENNVYTMNYTVDANTETEERAAYFKVYGLDDNGYTDAWSDLVTVTQAGATGPVTTGTIVFGNNGTKINATNVTGDDSMGNTWTITTEGTSSFTQNAAYSQVGSGNNPATSITFTMTLPQATAISAFEAKFGGFSGTAGDINLYVGETNVGSGALDASTDVTVTNTSTGLGTTLTVTVTGIAKGVKCYYISYTISNDPVINATTEDIAYNATSGVINYTISNYVAGTMAAETEAGWISNFTYAQNNNEGSVSFDVEENDGEERQATVTLTYTYDNDKTVTKDVTVTQAGVPAPASITVTPDAADVAFAGGAPEFAVTYESLAIEDANDFGVEFYDGDVVTGQPTWITDAAITGNTTDGFTLTVTVAANDGDAREAYMKVSAYDANNQLVYSDLVTISQDAYSEVVSYTLVTDASQIVSGKHYVIASGTNGSVKAMGSQATNNRNAVAAEVNSNTIQETAGVFEFIINGPQVIDEVSYFTIYDTNENSTGYLYAAGAGGTGSNNHLRTRETNANDDKGIWTISITDNKVEIKAKATGRNTMRYNSSSTCFSCYASGQQDIFLYVKDNDNDLEFYGNTTYTNLTISNTETITITNGATLTVTGNITNNGTAANLIIQDGGQLVHESPVVATVEKGTTAPSTWKANEDAGWYLIATPAESTEIATAFTGTFDLYKYSEPDAMWYTWTGGASTFDNITRGNGYLHASKTGETANFAGEMIGTEGTVTKDLVYTSTQSDDVRGFNLVGNPFTRNLHKGDMTLGGNSLNVFYVINDAQHSKLTAIDNDSYEIKPGEGFFVQATKADQQLVFNPSTKGANDFNNGFIKIVAGNENGTDNAYIQLGNGNTLRKMDISNKTSVYVINEGDDYAAARVEELAGSMLVNFKAAEDGEYTITVNAKNIEAHTMILFDDFTGETVDLLETPSYTFNASVNDSETRFKLIFDFNTYTGIGENYTNGNFAYQTGDEILVSGEGTLQVFDVMGRYVASYEVNGSKRISTSLFNAGVYIFKMNGENNMTQKIVVR